MVEDNKTRPYLTTLTPLRGIAAIFVVMHHSSVFFGSFLPSSITGFFENAWIWVDFFFVLSGFIISYSYSSYFREGVSLTAYKKYMRARFARVYPLHLFTLLWAFAVVAVIVYKATSIDQKMADLFNLKAFMPCLLLIQDLHLYTRSPLNFPSWSLSAEWWMYVIFPFLARHFATFTRRKTSILFFVIATAYLAMRFILGPRSEAAVESGPTINMVTDFGMLRCIAGFCTGMLVFVFYEARLGFALFRKSWCFVLFFTVTLYAIHANVTDILIIALFPFVLLCAAWNETAVKKIGSLRILQRLGDWSFSIYMVHAPIILMMLGYSVYKDPKLLSNVTAAAGTEEPNYKAGLIYCCILLVLTLTASAFTYRFIEIPAAKYLKRIFKTRPDRLETGVAK